VESSQPILQQIWNSRKALIGYGPRL
jgi:hypothetical protein